MNGLTKTEQQTLTAFEEVISQGLAAFVEVGNALAAIRDAKLYREVFLTFEEYLETRWNISKSQAYRLITGAKVAENMSPIGDVIPQSESQVRPLAQLPEEEQPQAWAEAVEAAGGEQPTASQVSEAVKARKPRKEKAFDWPAFFLEKFEEINSALTDSDANGCRIVINCATHTKELAERYAEQQEGE